MARYLSATDVWAIAFGCILGWGSFVMPGTTFLPIAGPAGTAIAMALSAGIMLVIARNYAYLMQARPDTGGVYAYAKEAFGRDHAFLCSWFLSLAYLTIVFLNATALFVITRTVFGGFWQVGYHYQVTGYDVFLGEILLTALLLVAVGLLFMFKKPLLQRLQTILALVLLAGVLILGFAALPHLQVDQLALMPQGYDAYPVGTVMTLVLLAPWAFAGFEAVSLETSHFDFSVRKSWPILIVAIVLAAGAYTVLTLVSTACVPQGFSSWQDYVAGLDGLTGVQSIPTFNLAYATMGDAGIVVVVVAALAAILTGVIGASRATVRLLSTMAEDNILSKEFLGTTFCVLFVMGISIVISFLGRNALNWFVDLVSFGAIVGYGYASAAAYKIAKTEGNKQTSVTGLIGTVIAVAFAVVQLVSRIGSIDTMSAPSFLLLALWCMLGFLFYWRTMRQSNLAEFSGASLSGTILFCLLFYSVVMWFSKTIVQVADTEQMQATVIGHATVLLLFVVVGLIVMLYLQSMLRRRQKELEREKIRAEESSKAKSQFLFNMSHDIRTPMNAIFGYTHLALQEPDVSPNVKDYIQKIDVSGRHLLTLIDDVLEMSQIENGKVVLELVQTDLKIVFDEVRNMFAVQMRDKNIDFTVDVSGVRDACVMCDKKRLVRMMQNLLSNAYKFTPEGGTVTVIVQQFDDGVPDADDYEVRVKDNGIGMAQEFVEKMFDAFERERTSTISGIQGTGLGMAITKSIVETMQGTIQVNTEPGKGTEFVVRFNLTFAETMAYESDEGKSEEAAKDALDFGTMRLLLAEDNKVNQEIMAMLLTGHGFEVDIVDDGAQAVQAIASAEPGSYDAVLMDIQMPNMDGYEATQRIRSMSDAKRARVPIVAVTANAFGDDVRAAHAVGMDAHIAKPIDPQKLMDTLADVLQESKSTSAFSESAPLEVAQPKSSFDTHAAASAAVLNKTE